MAGPAFRKSALYLLVAATAATAVPAVAQQQTRMSALEEVVVTA